MEKDAVYLVWKKYKTGNKYKVAELYKENGKYYFKIYFGKCKRS